MFLWQIYFAGNNTNVGNYLKCQILNSNKNIRLLMAFFRGMIWLKRCNARQVAAKILSFVSTAQTILRDHTELINYKAKNTKYECVSVFLPLLSGMQNALQ
jgi:hypothetical protein